MQMQTDCGEAVLGAGLEAVGGGVGAGVELEDEHVEEDGAVARELGAEGGAQVGVAARWVHLCSPSSAQASRLGGRGHGNGGCP